MKANFHLNSNCLDYLVCGMGDAWMAIASLRKKYDVALLKAVGHNVRITLSDLPHSDKVIEVPDDLFEETAFEKQFQ